MDLEIQEREKEGIRILDLRGPLRIGDSEAVLRAAISELTESGPVNIVLNLEHVAAIDDDGLGALVFGYARIARRGGSLKLLNLPRHLSLLVLTKVDTVFQVFSDEQDAINSFFPNRRASIRYDILDWVQEQAELPPAGLSE